MELLFHAQPILSIFDIWWLIVFRVANRAMGETDETSRRLSTARRPIAAASLPFPNTDSVIFIPFTFLFLQLGGVFGGGLLLWLFLPRKVQDPPTIVARSEGTVGTFLFFFLFLFIPRNPPSPPSYPCPPVLAAQPPLTRCRASLQKTVIERVLIQRKK